ncbi:MAG TPA: hypothetical protein ENG66_05235 [Thermococcus sp.]|nr:hypothetical protein [Thermococcus sp.]
MEKYLSYGGGVNSTALLLLLTEKGENFEVVFVDTGVEYPETYEYIEYLKTLGFEITVLKPKVKGKNGKFYDNLYEYCYDHKFLPSIYLRWCTYRFKLIPIWEYVKKPCIMYIGISYDERHRVLKKGYYDKKAKGIKPVYPLVELKITRYDCLRIIKQHGLKVPGKSGCWICPVQSKKRLLWLRTKHPNLFKKIIELEKRRGHSLKEKPIEELVPNIKPISKFLMW